jgi:UPF0271 protein
VVKNMEIILNCDCGESIGDDAAILPHVGAANIACGGHAGDAATMRETLRLCRQLGVSAGAHPGYPDRATFGRAVLPMTPDEVEPTVREQIEILALIAQDEGVVLTHIKPHGALYNHAAAHTDSANAIARAVVAVDPNLVFVGLAGSALIEAGRAHGLRVAAEAFADRAYDVETHRLWPTGGHGASLPVLRNRSLPGALIEDDGQALTQVLSIVRAGHVTAHDGQRVPLQADTICLHSDTPGAARRAAFLQAGLAEAGVILSRFVRRCAECGAPLKEGQPCSAYFDACMALELTDPRFGAVHHLTVPAYHLQHPSRVSAAGWLAMWQILHAFVVEGTSPTEMRRKNSAAFAPGNKPFSLKRGNHLALPASFTWTRTIADIRVAEPHEYCADVRHWAAAALVDAQHIVEP